jgi:purine-binding chemotaxis protein CheW
LIIDQIGEVLSLEPHRFERCPENLDPKWRKVSKGVYRLEDTLLVVLDVDLLMNFENTARAA